MSNDETPITRQSGEDSAIEFCFGLLRTKVPTNEHWAIKVLALLLMFLLAAGMIAAATLGGAGILSELLVLIA
ncbi:MAG: hypothetical protein AAGI91_09060 [Bacteroidota bacterium]